MVTWQGALRLTVTTVAKRFVPLCAVVFACVLPALALRTAMPWMMREELAGIRLDRLVLDIDKLRPILEKVGTVALFAVVVLFLVFVLSLVSQAFTLGITRAALSGTRTTIGASVRVGFARFPVVLAIAIIQSVAIAIGSLACLVPGLILTAALFLSVPAAVAEGLGVGQALGRSWDLSRGHRGAIIVALSVLQTVAWLATTAASFAASPPIGTPGSMESMTAVQAGTSVILGVFAVFFAVLANVFYLQIVAGNTPETPHLADSA